MKKLFVRLAASSAIVASLGAPALASDVSLHATGPGSTNAVTSINHNHWNNLNYNRVGLGNWNSQQARSGHVCACGNTWIGGSLSSGSAHNQNQTHNLVNLSNHSTGFGGFNHGSGNHTASIHLTGPDSNNHIRFSNHNRFTQVNHNSVNLTNANHQSAKSGDVSLSHNTVVHGGAQSGNATNHNASQNVVAISNQSPTFAPGTSGHNTASINTTGPGSHNQIKLHNSSDTNLVNHNAVSISNSNHQTATSGDVNINHNTVVDGGGHSGDATNHNSTENEVSVTN